MTELPTPHFITLDFDERTTDEQFRRGDEFFELLNRRRTVRDYSERDVPFELTEKAIATAGHGSVGREHAAGEICCSS